MDPLLQKSGTQLAALIRSREVSAREVLEKHIEHIKKVNPLINALVEDRFAWAREEADEADRQLESTSGKGLPPLHGVPCSIKENLAHVGMPNTCGLAHRKGVVLQYDATAVARIRQAGAISMGVTNIPEFCMWIETYNNIYGRCKNPYDTRRITGGSSGGEGALISAGGSPFGLGSDIAGSIRYPAFFNGVFGHKPSGGLVPGTGHYPQLGDKVGRYNTVGPLARRAEDLFPLLKIIAGPDDKDGSCLKYRLRDPSRVKLDRLNVISIENHGSFRIDEDLRRAQQKCADYLEEKGARVFRNLRLDSIDRCLEIWASMVVSQMEGSVEDFVSGGDEINIPRELLRMGLRRSGHTAPIMVLVMLEKLYRFFEQPPRGDKLNQFTRKFFDAGLQLKEDLQKLLDNNGIILYPSFSTTAPVHKRPLYSPFNTTYMMMANVMELPSTQVPLGLNHRGLPLGLQIIGNQGYDHLTIAAAMELEEAFGGWIPPWEAKRGEDRKHSVSAVLT